MSQRVFISYGDPAELGRSGFDVEHYQDLTVEGRHRIDPALWDDPGHVEQELRRATVTIVLIGRGESDVVKRDIQWSLEHGKGLVGVRLDPGATPPDLLYEAGAEILDWTNPVDVNYLPRAVGAAARSAALLERAAARGTGSGRSCARPTSRRRESD